MLADYIKTFPQFLLPKQGLTTLAGVLANVQSPGIKNALIRQFIRRYDVNMNEALEEDPEKYATFNDFFIRRLKSDARSIADADVISPVDGFVSETGTIKAGQIIQAKGRDYNVRDLLVCDEAISQEFEQGQFATLYLSPKDYHRVHMPMDGILKEMIYVPGKLFSVQPTTTRIVRHLFARNERLVVFFTTNAGLMAMVLVGATIVGGIGTSWHGDVQRGRKRMHFLYPYEDSRTLYKGDEMGYFKLGSTVILLFTNHSTLQWKESLRSGSRILFGEPLGEFSTMI